MKDPVQEYFQVGTIQRVAHPPVDYPILESVRTICYDEYFSVLGTAYIENQDTGDHARDMLAQGYMKVCYGAQPRLLGLELSPNDLDEKGGKKTETVLIDSIDEAEYMGAEGTTSLTGKWESEIKGQTYAQPLKTTRAVYSYAASKKMVVEPEVFDFGMDKATLIGSASYAARLTADMRMTCNNFGLLVDLSHFSTTYETPQFVTQTPRPYITHLRIDNIMVKESCKACGDQHPQSGFSESANGTMQLVDSLTALGEEGFFNKEESYTLSLEVKPWAGEDEDIILVSTRWVINRVWALVEDEA